MELQTIIEQLRKELLEVAEFSSETVLNYTSCVLSYSEFATEQLKIDPLKSGSRHLRQWLTLLKQKGLSNSRLQHHQCALKHFFDLLVKMSLCDRSPADALFPIRKTKSDRNEPLHKDILFRLLRTMDLNNWIQERNFIIISIFWALGIRLNELIDLKVGDFEPNHDQENKIGLLRVHGKGKKQRALFVVDKLYDNLLNYLKHPQSPKKKTEPLFPATQTNKAISSDRIQRMIKEAAHKAGITQRITPHVLRHCFATEMFQQNVPPEDIQALLGHDNLIETSIYIHISPQQQQKALERITISGGKS